MRVSGARIRELRLARRLDQHSLADRLRDRGYGTTQATVSRWERGQSPRSYVLPVLAEELGVAVADLYAETDDEEDSASVHTMSDEELFDVLVERAILRREHRRAAAVAA